MSQASAKKNSKIDGRPKQTKQEALAGFWQNVKKRRKDETEWNQVQNFENKKKKQEADNSVFEMIPMCGFQVKLPIGMEPYPTQKLMMVKILTALNTKQNIIAESPTGSGKTLALLASTCAWLVKYKEQVKESRSKCNVHGDYKPVVKENSQLDETIDVGEQSKDVLKDINGIQHEPTLEKDAPSGPNSEKTAKPQPPVCSCLPKVRIYYGTRTHKQIGQVVKEFRRLPYAGILRHTILASRDQSCINDAARKSRDITSYCKELLSDEGLGCIHKTNIRSHKMESPAVMRKHVEINTETIFDIEDLVDGLHKAKISVCPYFTSTRVLTGDSDIIFTPFTYLVDPIIRSASDVTLKESIVILDEAHNIEDTCREGASFTFLEREIADALLSFKTKAQKLGDKASEMAVALFREGSAQLELLRQYNKDLNILIDFLNEIWAWFQETAKPAQSVNLDVFTKQKNLVRGWNQMLNSLNDSEKKRTLILKKEMKKYECVHEALKAVADIKEEDKNLLLDFRPSGPALIMLEKWLFFNGYFQNTKFQSTYRMNICMEKGNASMSQASYKDTKYDGQGPKNIGYNSAEDLWMDSSTGPWNVKPIMPGFKTSISMWAMSPAITFTDAFENVRSVILASGTLCPIETLKTELGIPFKLEVEGKQVIPNERIFASVVPSGPGGTMLNLTQNRMKANPQILEEVAQVIKDVCLTVPRGILCFCSSYRMVESLMNTLRESCSAINRKKIIFEEPKQSSGLNDVMQKYEHVLNHPRQYGQEIDGALMMAVFRGKISEGIDFADDKARVVISVGIPYPNFGDFQVTEKKKYNDENCVSMGILNGDNWYSTQAYRALNQALGRCLRHRNDWGALVLIDERLVSQSRQYEHLANRSSSASSKVSKWIREQLRVYHDYNEFGGSLYSFVQSMNNSPLPEEDAERTIETTID